MWHRLKPAFSLFLLAPLIAEYLLGSLSFRQLWLFPIMALMYGAGALFVREVARRSHRGWPTILGLGVAYALIEEGLATQSLFNPHYLGLHLLDYGFVPALGIGVPWTAYVLILHVAWSIAVPIALVEKLFPEQRIAPWLGKPGFAISGIVYLLGLALVTSGTRQKERFAASSAQLLVTATLAVIVIVTAVALFRPQRTVSLPPAVVSRRRPWVFGLLAFVAGSAFHLATQLGSGFFSPTVAVAIALALPGLVIAATRAEIKSGRWTDAHTDALMIGGLLAYCWLGFFLTARLHGAHTIPGQLFPCAIVLFLIYRLSRNAPFARP